MVIIKLKDHNPETNKKIIIEKNESKISVDYFSKTITYNSDQYSIYEIEKIRFSELSDDMPIRKGVYNLLRKNLKMYFDNFIKKG